MIIRKIDTKKDKNIMFDIVRYEDREDVFGIASIGNFNISPISKYGLTYIMLRDEEYKNIEDIMGVVEIMPSFDRELAYIYGFSIAPNYRNKGYSKKLMQFIINELKKMGIKKIELTVDKDNIIAQNLYKKFDFFEIEKLENEYGDNIERYLYRRVEKITHYYTNNDNLKSNENTINYNIMNNNFNFITDNGVFSKAKVDFGTDLMLKTFLKNEKIDNQKIADYGCGYGVVGIVLGKLNNSKIYSIDINDRAINLTKKNFELNKVESKSVSNELPKDMNYILLNPPIRTGKKNVFEMYQKAYDSLVNNGIFYIVIQTKQGAKSSLEKLEEIFKNKVETLEIKDGYRIFRVVKNE